MAETNPTLKVEYLSVERVRPDPANPRQHSRAQISQIAKSVEAFGFNVPILIDANNSIRAGHGRFAAAKKLKLSRVPCIRLEHLTPEQAKAFQIADNRLNELSAFDDKLVGEVLKDLASCELNFDLEVTGFCPAEIDLLIGGLTSEAVEPDRADEVPAPSEIAVSKPGDVWRLGRHAIVCGSSLDPTSFSAVMGDSLAQVVFADAPYNVRISGHASGRGKIKHPEFEMASGEMTPEEFSAFLKNSCTLAERFSSDGSVHYWCMDWRHAREILDAGHAVYNQQLNLCVWAKTNAGKRRQIARDVMGEIDLKKLVAPDFTVSLRPGSPGLDVLDESAIPASYYEPREPRLNRAALLADLKGGTSITGVQLSCPAPVLSVRTK